jgi:hypothetical protein
MEAVGLPSAAIHRRRFVVKADAAAALIDALPEDTVTAHVVGSCSYEPVEPKLKPPGTKLLKLCDVILSTSAFKFNLRRYNVVRTYLKPSKRGTLSSAGACTRPLPGSTYALSVG